MSAENTQFSTEPVATMSEDEVLGAAWDQSERDNGAVRAEDGKFTPEKGEPVADEPAAPLPEGEVVEEAGQPAEEVAPVAPVVPLPANMQGMDGEWAKIPADVQSKLAARQNELQSRMTEQGRQLTEFRPFGDIISRNRDLFDGRSTADGAPATAAHSIEALFEAQRRLEADPVSTLLAIADSYGAREVLARAISQNFVPQPNQQQPGMSRVDAERLSREVAQATWSENERIRQGDELVARLSKDKPLYQEIPEETFVFFVNQSRARLGEAASPEAVFESAYDSAVHADPQLRSKATVAKPAPAAPSDPKRTADAKRATSINVTSTSSGKGRELTEDELLGKIYDENRKG